MSRGRLSVVGTGVGTFVVVILGLFAFLVGVDVLASFAPQFRELVILVASLSVFALILMFILLLFGIGGTARVMRGGRR